MAITTNSVIEQFGTQDKVTGTSSAVSAGTMSFSGDIVTWTNDDDAISASAVLEFSFGVAPSSGASINLYARLMNIQSTNDAVEPALDYQHTYLGSFPVDNVTTAQYAAIEISLPNTKSGQEYDFYIENGADQTLSSGWDLYITPKALAPHA